MKPDLVLAEWHRAREALRAAELLTEGNCFADAVSRTYYAVLHAAKAALEVHDVHADSHGGVRQMFGLHLIRPGEIEKEWASHLGKGFDERLAADYDPEVSFSEQDALREYRETRKFIKRIRRYLREKGFAESQLRKRKRG